MSRFKRSSAGVAAALAAVLAAAGCASVLHGRGGMPWPAEEIARAQATIAGAGGITGEATLVEYRNGEGRMVRVMLRAKGLAPGLHGVHLHQTGDCGNDFKAAGGHFDPGPFGEPEQKNHPFHMGDLPNMRVGPDGTGELDVVTTRVTLTEGPVSLFDADGASLMIHAEPDRHNAEQAGGGRVACGVIRRQ